MADSVFTYDASTWSVTPAMKEAYNKNGYILVRQMLNRKEIEKVKAALENPDGVQRFAYTREDGKKRTNKIVLWNHPGHDITGVLAKTQRVAGTMEQLMGGDEVYHYHAKLIMKEAKTGGTFLWHQDYGYWYRNGCLYPDMASVFIPVDDTDRANGCLQVLRGSHRLGRVDHLDIADQLGADPERVEQAQKVLEHIYVEMKARDMLFFHCNLLHTSDQNSSDRRRWVFIVSFNKRSNNPYKEHHHPQYTPMTKVEDSALLECDETKNQEGKWFMVPGGLFCVA
ncbi:LOW QUALITY PROTEIN: L-proline trans-4-hydroxylase-like [Homarus americanus]|uniref:LOW QUALITY PROTEIN: L-proline trans-4-hydroxylase-like n=1 Tax=Homarus americanus TaxID=6706 RepID=UPI001C4424D8|nr:LOW QUALITY PROTEIN: L-proline trans-4-hydroxylase-like [Homarus americanus]